MNALTKDFTDAIEKQLGVLDDNVRKALEDSGFAKAAVQDVEQKLVRRGGEGEFGETKSWGSQAVDRIDDVRSYFENRSSKGSMSLSVKTTITSAAGSGAGLIVPQRDTTLTLPHRRMTIRDLLPVIQVSTGTVEYARLPSSTNATATVAEAALKPESAMAFDLVTTPIRTIAHWIPASRQIIDDAPQLRGVIDGELMYGLLYAEELQLLNGDGLGTNLNGIYTQATAFAAGPLIVASPSRIDVIGAAIYQQNLTDLPADGIVMNPSDWTGIQLIKDSAGNYILGDPQAGAQPRLFGLPVVTTAAMTSGNFLVGNFQGSATLYDRWQPRVELSTEHADYFVRNLVALLCEERIGLAVKRTLGFTKGTFSTAIVDLTS